MDTSNSFSRPDSDSVALALEILRRRFPQVCLWFGNSTKHWWALANGQLIEARTPQELGQCLDLAGVGGEVRTTQRRPDDESSHARRELNRR